MIVSGFSGESPLVGAVRLVNPAALATQNVFSDTNGVSNTAPSGPGVVKGAPVPLVPTAITSSVKGACAVPVSFGPAVIAQASVPGRAPVVPVVQLAVSVPVDQCRATAELAAQLPPDTEIEHVVVAVTRSHELGLTEMNGVGVIVADEIV